MKCAVVTGGTGALGEAVVERFLQDGWRVYATWQSAASAERVRSRSRDAGDLRLHQVDLTDSISVDGFFQEVARSEPALDVLCNLAGGFETAPVEETDPEVWDQMLALNATSAFLSIRSAIPLLRLSDGGAIVNVASASALDGTVPGMGAYLASKSAVISLTRSLAKELAPDGITVNAVAPTTIDTLANRKAMPDAGTHTWLTPEEIAGVIAFLTGPEARIMTGNVVALSKG
ncbi:MAG: SDR family oxidoreductase [Gemmatimonadota bacterium]|nr:SDR family oxidoreductase [Gemmatimonadota bacterium]